MFKYNYVTLLKIYKKLNLMIVFQKLDQVIKDNSLRLCNT